MCRKVACTFCFHLYPPTWITCTETWNINFSDFFCFNSLADAQKELDETKSKSATTLLATEDEILQLRAEWVMHSNTAVICMYSKCSIQYVLPCWCEPCLCFSLRSAHEQLEIYKRKLDALDDYERQIRLLRDEVSYLSTEKAMLQERYTTYTHTDPTTQNNFSNDDVVLVCFSLRLVRSRSPSPLPRLSSSSSPKRSESPTRAQLTNSSRHARLVSRFSDLYAVERLEAQTLLRRYIADIEMVQKIIFIAVVVRPIM